MALRKWPKYRQDRRAWNRLGGRVDSQHPILTDFSDLAGTAKGHYFHQDLLVSQFVFDSNPRRHVDVGSRLDGFVAHVASFRRVEVLDIRALNKSQHENIVFRRQDLMAENFELNEVTDSLSCLHAIEHFGLGRYGDPIDPLGHLKAFENLLGMLEPGGMLYISFPIGRRDAVVFNAHRVFHPLSIFRWPLAQGLIQLERFDFVDDEGKLHKNVDLLSQVPEVNYGCGIYSFRRVSQETE